MSFILITTIFLINFTALDSANILGIFPFPYYSHQKLHHSVMRALLERGHSATIFTTYPHDYGGNPNVTQVALPESNEIHKRHTDMLMYKRKRMNWFEIMLRHELVSYAEAIEYELNLPEMQDIIHNSSKYHFDMLIIECYFCSFVLLAEIYDCPIVIVGSSDLPSPVYGLMGSDINPLVYSDSEFLPYIHGEMNMLQKVNSLGFYLYYDLLHRLYYFFRSSYFDWMYFRHLRMSHVLPMTRRIALLMANTNVGFGHVRALKPDCIQIGLISVEAPRDIKDMEIKRFLDSSKNGVIVMALGSRADPRSLGTENVRKFMSAFNQSDMNVLWKLHGIDQGIDLAENVKIVNWMPLSDVLAHPNVKLLIFHGGLLTTYEAIDREVPIISFPLVFDQYMNTKLMVKHGIATEMDLNDFDDQKLHEAIKDMIKPKYTENVRKLKTRVYDKPINSKELAVWHIEKVLRTSGPYKRSFNSIYESSLLHMVLYVTLFVVSIKYVIKKAVFRKE